MATYRVKAPDGNTYRVNGPDGATDEQVRAKVLELHPEAGQAPKPAPKPKEQSWGDTLGRYASMAGRAVTETAGETLGALTHVIPVVSTFEHALPEGVRPSDVIRKGIDYVNTKYKAATPDTTTERIAYGAGKGALSALAGGGGQGVKRLGTELVSGALAGGAGEAAKPLGAGAQVAAALAAGTVPTTLASGAKNAAGTIRSFTDSGEERAAKILQMSAGSPQEARAAQVAIAAAPKQASGAEPTLAELARNRGLAALQRSTPSNRLQSRLQTNADVRSTAAGAATDLGKGQVQDVKTASTIKQLQNEAELEQAKQLGLPSGPGERVNAGAEHRQVFEANYDAAKAKTKAAYNVPELTNPVPVAIPKKIYRDIRANTKDFYGDAGGARPAEVSSIIRDLRQKVRTGTATTKTVANIDRRLADFAGEATVNNRQSEAAYATRFREILAKHADENMPPDVKAAMDNARAVRRDQGQRYEQNTIGNIFGEKQYDQAVTPNTQLPGALVRTGAKGGTIADELKAAIGPHASENLVRQELRRLVDENKLGGTERQAGNFGELLQRFPWLKGEVDAIHQRSSLNKAFTQTEFGKLADPNTDAQLHITNLLTKQDGTGFSNLVNDIKGTKDPEAVAGLRRVMSDSIKEAGKSTKLDAAGRSIPDTNKMIGAIDNVLARHNGLLDSDQVKALGGIRNEMAGANYAGHAGVNERTGYDKTIPFVAGNIARTIRWAVSHFSNEGKINDLINEAILNPKTAVELLGRKTPDRLRNFRRTIGRASRGTVYATNQFVQ